MARFALPFIGPAYRSRSLNASAQRCINLYLESGEQAGQPALYGTPGLVLKATCGPGPIRGMCAAGGYVWLVSGPWVMRLGADWSHITLGALTTSTGRVAMAANPTEVLIVDGEGGYLIDISGPGLVPISDPDFPAGVTQACYIDGYFIVAGDNSGRFYINEAADSGSAWNGTDFATAEGSPDNTLGIIANHRELWLVGENSAEVWINTGNATFPFERSGNVFIEHGTAAGWTLAKIDNTVFWLGSDQLGAGMVYRADGYVPARLSTHAIEYAIAGYPKISDAFAFCYQQEGHSFYVLTFPVGGETWVYDVSTGAWHQRAALHTATGELSAWRPSCHAFAFAENLVGDSKTGKVWAMDLDAYTDDGEPIKRIRATATTSDRQLVQFFSMLQVQMETGIGTAADPAPQMTLRYSGDGGHTWIMEGPRPMGRVGEYAARCVWWRLGSGRNRVWEIATTAPVKIALIGAYLEGDVGNA